MILTMDPEDKGKQGAKDKFVTDDRDLDVKDIPYMPAEVTPENWYECHISVNVLVRA